MSGAPELQSKLGEVIGLMQALRLMIRHLATRVDPDLELAQLLQRVSADVEEMQRRCDSFVASHPDIKQSRITGTAREIKLNAAQRVPSNTTTPELVRLLVRSAEDIVARWHAVSTLIHTRHDPPTAGLVHAAILLHTDHVRALARHAA